MVSDKPEVKQSNSVKINLRSEWSIYSWCLLLAVILWVLTGLNETYLSTLIVQAKYTNIPKDKIYVHPLPKDIKVQVQASGWDLFTNWILSSKEELNIDMTQYAHKAYIVSNTRIKEELRLKLAHKMTIISIDPDTIYLSREAKMSRRVPIVLKLNINCDKHYGISDKIKLSPDFVTICGPQSLVRQIQYIETRDTVIDDVDKSQTYAIDLKAMPYSSLSADTNTIKVSIPVTELVEAKTNVSINVINKHGRNYQVLPGKVSVTYQVPKGKEKKIRTTLFEAIVDASKTDSALNGQLKIQIINHPDYTYNFKLKPETAKISIK